MALHTLALCAGGGGLEIGLAGCLETRVVCYVERELSAAIVLVEAMEAGRLDTAPVWSDLETFSGRGWAGKVDIVTAGFPCQDVSSLGKRAGVEGERTGLWRHVARVAGEVRPRLVVLENVADLLAGGGGQWYAAILGDLASMGFDARWGCLRAEHAGAPHGRGRVFVVAYPEHEGCGELWQAHNHDGRHAPWNDFNGRRAELGLFPPGPGDEEGWGDVPEDYWPLERGFRRVADGVARRARLVPTEDAQSAFDW